MQSIHIAWIIFDIALPVIFIGLNEFWVRKGLAFGIARSINIFYWLTLAAIWLAGDLNFVPKWMTHILGAIVIAAYLITLLSGGGGPKNRRKRAAWKMRSKEWLARGIPARRPA